jgi:hypothetical protein
MTFSVVPYTMVSFAAKLLAGRKARAAMTKISNKNFAILISQPSSYSQNGTINPSC